MKTILVPTDFSENATHALDYAIDLAKDHQASIILVNAWEIIYPSTDIQAPLEFVSKLLRFAELSAFEQLKPLASKVSASGVPCLFYDQRGTVVNVVREMVDKHAIDLVIMGTKGASGLKEVFIGSNAARVMRQVKCPIIVVPGGALFKGLKRITYATNYHSSDIESLRKVVQLARLSEAEITLLHVADEHHSYGAAEAILKTFTAKVREHVQYESVAYHIIYGSDAGKKLYEYVKQEHADLFVMSAPERNLFDRWFGRSISKAMAYHSKTPLMVFHH